VEEAGAAAVTAIGGIGTDLTAAVTAFATAVAMSTDVGGAGPGAVAAAAGAAGPGGTAGGGPGAGTKPAAESAMSVPHCRQFNPSRKCSACMPIVIFNSCTKLYAMACCTASLKFASVRRRLGYRWPAEIEKEHLAHRGVIGVGSAASTAFGIIKSSRILFLIITTGSATKVVLDGGAVTVNRSSISVKASE